MIADILGTAAIVATVLWYIALMLYAFRATK